MRKLLRHLEPDRVLETVGGMCIAAGIGLLLGPAAGFIAIGMILVVLSLTL